MDAVYDSVMGRGVPLKEKPSFYFRRNVWVSADPDEKSLPAMVDLCGSDRGCLSSSQVGPILRRTRHE